MKLAFIAMSILVISLVSAGGSPRSAEAATCAYTLGFKTLHDLMPAIVGGCLVDEHHNPTNGDGLQETAGPTGTGGLLVWRKADNWTAYTDGYHTWINGPLGLQQRLNVGPLFPWEATPSVVAPASSPAPVATATPAPTFDYYVETSTVLGDVRPGGSQTFCARLSAIGGPPVGGLPARLSIYGHNYFATTQLPDGNACVSAPVPLSAQDCSFLGFITYNGKELTTRIHNEHCTVLPF